MDAVQVEKAVKALGDKPTLKNFIEQFGVFAQGPDGLAKIRNLVLQLAASGRLIVRRDEEEPVSKLLDKIQNEKNRLVKEKLYKKQKPLPEISEGEIPFDIPSHWVWARLGNVGLGATGKTPRTKKSEFWGENIPFIGPGQITPSGKILSADKYLTELGKKESVEAVPLDILMVCIGGSIGKTALVTERLTFNQQINRIRPLCVNSIFINYLLSAPYFLESVLNASTGSATPIINRMKWEALLLPLPPLEEQKRIVAKVDELMALCDQLQAQQQQQANTLLKANTAAIHALLTTDKQPQKTNNPPPKNKKQKNLDPAWQRIANNFHTLYGNTLPMPPGQGRQKKYFVGLENVKQLRQMIVQLAMFGKLIPQNSAESVDSLMKAVKYEKSKYTRRNIEKIDDALPLPAIPRNWEWVTLDQLSQDIHYGYTASANHEITKVRLLRITDIQNDKVDWMNVPGCEIDDKKLSKNKLYEGDLLIARTGGTIGKTYLVNNLTVNAVFASYLIRFKPLKAIWPEYIKLYTLSKIYWDQLADNTSGSAQPNVNATSLKSMVIPFPPMEEQKRIVAKVDQLMAHCDQLEQQLTTAYSDAEKLINSTIKQLVA